MSKVRSLVECAKKVKARREAEGSRPKASLDSTRKTQAEMDVRPEGCEAAPSSATELPAGLDCVELPPWPTDSPENRLRGAMSPLLGRPRTRVFTAPPSRKASAKPKQGEQGRCIHKGRLRRDQPIGFERICPEIIEIR